MNSPKKRRSKRRRLPSTRETVLLHLRWGWWLLAVFGLLGMLLDSFHGFQQTFYLADDVPFRRPLWMSAHVSGVVLGIVNISFAASLDRFSASGVVRVRSSLGLIAASVAMPSGLFLAGLFLHDDRPGTGLLLFYMGALLLVSSLALMARAWTKG